jgi:hypothetical protein
MQITLFSQMAEFHAKFLGNIGLLKERYVDYNIGQTYILQSIKVSPGLIMSLVHEMIQLDERVIVFELTPTDDYAKELFTNLVELLSPLIDQRDEGHEINDFMDYSCGIVESQFPKFDITSLPACRDTLCAETDQ